MEAIILAGGLGTRLRAVVPDLPKPMAPVAGRPFLEHLLDRLADQGARRVVLSIGYRGELIETHFGGRYRDMELVYALEQEPLGTGGAIAFALTHAKAEQVLILNGDTFLEMDYQGFMQRCSSNAAALGIVVRLVPDTARYGRCELDHGIVRRFSEKGIAGPGLINAGVYCVENDIFSDFAMPPQFSFEQDFVGRYLQRLQPLGFSVDGYFIDIGVPEDFHRAQSDFASGRGRKYLLP